MQKGFWSIVKVWSFYFLNNIRDKNFAFPYLRKATTPNLLGIGHFERMLFDQSTQSQFVYHEITSTCPTAKFFYYPEIISGLIHKHASEYHFTDNSDSKDYIG